MEGNTLRLSNWVGDSRRAELLMKTFPIKISSKTNDLRCDIEDFRAEIKFSAETRVDKKYLPQVEKSTKSKLMEHLHRQIYGDIQTALFYAEEDFHKMRPEDLPLLLTNTFNNLRKSIPTITYD